jgi:hypothetical protein
MEARLRSLATRHFCIWELDRYRPGLCAVRGANRQGTRSCTVGDGYHAVHESLLYQLSEVVPLSTLLVCVDDKEICGTWHTNLIEHPIIDSM